MTLNEISELQVTNKIHTLHQLEKKKGKKG